MRFFPFLFWGVPSKAAYLAKRVTLLSRIAGNLGFKGLQQFAWPRMCFLVQGLGLRSFWESPCAGNCTTSGNQMSTELKEGFGADFTASNDMK